MFIPWSNFLGCSNSNTMFFECRLTCLLHHKVSLLIFYLCLIGYFIVPSFLFVLIFSDIDEKSLIQVKLVRRRNASAPHFPFLYLLCWLYSIVIFYFLFTFFLPLSFFLCSSSVRSCSSSKQKMSCIVLTRHNNTAK